jgi:hypothetical protein
MTILALGSFLLGVVFGRFFYGLDTYLGVFFSRPFTSTSHFSPSPFFRYACKQAMCPSCF